MILNTLRNLFTAKPPLPIPYSCGATKAECAEITAAILRLASQKGLQVRNLAQSPIREHVDGYGTHEAILVDFQFNHYALPMYILFRGYGTSRIEALKDLYDSMLETTCPTP